MDAPSFVSILPNLSIGVVSILGLVYVVIRFLQALDDRADKHEVAMTKREEAIRNLESDVRRNLTDQLAKNTVALTDVARVMGRVVRHMDEK